MDTFEGNDYRMVERCGNCEYIEKFQEKYKCKKLHAKANKNDKLVNINAVCNLWLIREDLRGANISIPYIERDHHCNEV